jgi:hypothetical protein
MNERSRNRTSWLEGVMYAAAAAIAVIAVGRMAPSEPPAPAIAEAGMVSETGEMTIITFASGVGDEDYVAVLDQRGGNVIVYEGNQWRGLELQEVVSVDELMERVRAAGPTNRR